MGGLSIGIGIGVKYQGGMNQGDFIPPTPPPEQEITDALLMEDGSLFLMEDGTYFMLENETQAQSSAIPKINKSYWNF